MHHFVCFLFTNFHQNLHEQINVIVGCVEDELRGQFPKDKQQQIDF